MGAVTTMVSSVGASAAIAGEAQATIAMVTAQAFEPKNSDVFIVYPELHGLVDHKVI
jgi:hypothetical protein